MTERPRCDFAPAPWSRAAGALLVAVALTAFLPAAVGATPPLTPYRALEKRAEKEGAAAVRPAYQQKVQEILARLDQQTADRQTTDRQAVEDAAPRESLQRTLTILWLYDYLRSWALVEARGLRRGESGAGEVAGKSLEPLLDAAEKAAAHWSVEAPRMRSLTSRMTPAARERLGMPESVEGSVANDRDQALRQVALLAKLAGARAQLDRVFRLAPQGIGSAHSAAEFLARQEDVDALLGTAPTAPTAPTAIDERAAAKAAPLSAAEQEAVRQVVHDFWDAFLRRDAAAVERLFLDPAAARGLTSRMGEASLVSYDLAAARFAFERTAPDRVRVRVDHVAAVELRQGRRVATVGGKTFDVALKGGRALIVQVGR